MTSLSFTEGSQQPPTPRDTTKQLLPNLVDGTAAIRPEALYALIPAAYTSYNDGYREVRYRQLANAVNGVAWLLSRELGSGEKSATLAYVGPNDISYVVMILGAIKAGYSILSLSPRNTKADHASLFEATKCQTLLTLKQPYSATVKAILEGLSEHPPRIVHVPSIYELLDQEHEHFPYTDTYEAAKDKPIVTVHTSGTTKTPKPVTYTHVFVSRMVTWGQQTPPAGYRDVSSYMRATRIFSALPFFHSGAVFLALFNGVHTQSLVVTPLGGAPLTAQSVVDGLRHVDVDCLQLPSFLMEQIAKNEEMLEFVTQKVKVVGYGGGEISQAAGDAFAAKVNVIVFNGSTEAATYPLIRPIKGYSSKDWKYIQPHPTTNLTFERSEDEGSDLYEGVLVRNADSNHLQPVFTIFPQLDKFRTRDLWSPHPSKPGLWLWRGRVDDMIVSATGELCNPVPLEQRLMRLPEVSAALMAGMGRYQKALLIEPADQYPCTHAIEKQEFLDRIWPTVEAANEDMPAVSHIQRTHVMLTSPTQPLLRAGKGTVQRGPSLKLYEKQLNELYGTEGDGIGDPSAPFKVHYS